MRVVIAGIGLMWAASAAAVTVELRPGDDVAALTGSLQAGDLFLFHGGIYELPGPLDWSGAGTAEAPITLRAVDGAIPTLRLMAGGHAVRIRDAAHVHVSGLVIEGEPAHAEASGFTGLAIHGSEDVVVDDVEVRQVGGTGLALWGDNARVTLRRVHVHGVRSGAGISIGCGDASCWTRDSVLENNLVHDVRGERRPGIELLRGGQGNALVDNVVHAVTGVGIAVSSAEYGAANEVRGNVVFGATDSGIRVEGAAVVRNNLVFEIDGVGLRATDRFADALSDVVIAHNTVVGTSDWGIRVDGWAGRDGMVLANNAVSNPLGMAFHVDEGELDAGNRVVGNVMTGLVEGLDPALGQVRAGAGHDDFVDVDGWDLYPSETSTLLAAADADAGSWVPEDDFSGYARDGLAPDVGAYEYVGAGNPGWPVQEGFKEAAAPRVDGEELGGCGKGGEAGALLGPALALLGRRRRRDQPSSGR